MNLLDVSAVVPDHTNDPFLDQLEEFTVIQNAPVAQWIHNVLGDSCIKNCLAVQWSDPNAVLSRRE